VDRTPDFVARQRGNYPFDLPPVAETGDIAVVPALFGTHGRLEAGIVAEAFDQVRCVSKSVPPMDEGIIHASRYRPLAFPD